MLPSIGDTKSQSTKAAPPRLGFLKKLGFVFIFFIVFADIFNLSYGSFHNDDRGFTTKNQDVMCILHTQPRARTHTHTHTHMRTRANTHIQKRKKKIEEKKERKKKIIIIIIPNAKGKRKKNTRQKKVEAYHSEHLRNYPVVYYPSTPDKDFFTISLQMVHRIRSSQSSSSTI